MNTERFTIRQITGMFEKPETIVSADKAAINSVVERFPYFSPGRYLQAARRQTIQPFSPDMMTGMQLYMGNWVLFHQFLGKATDSMTVQSYYESASSSGELMTDDFTVAHKSKQQPVQEAAPAIEDNLIEPASSGDYFRKEGVAVSDEIPDTDIWDSTGKLYYHDDNVDEEKSLVVMRGFNEWLMYYRDKKEQKESDDERKKEIKANWRKERLAAAMDEENDADDEIPEQVLEMAVNSIAKEDGLISESLADVMVKQGKYDKALDMYRKLSLRNPEKNTYFADKIETILKLKNS